MIRDRLGAKPLYAEPGITLGGSRRRFAPVYCYIPELHPTRLRGSGFGRADIASRAVSALAPVLGAALWPAPGLTWTFVVIGIDVVVSVIWRAVAVPEIRGVELDEDEDTEGARPGPAVDPASAGGTG